MKKFFVALLVLALAASNVFAEFTFSGRFFGTWKIIAGESGKERGAAGIVDVNSDWLTTRLGLSDNWIQTRLQVTAANEEGTWGGWFRIQPSDLNPAHGWIWWQPITQIKATLGLIDGFRPFGHIGTLDVHDYLGAASAGSAVAEIFPAYDAAQGFSLLVTPIANLKIGVSTPIIAKKDKTFPANEKQPAEVSYRKIGGWVAYTLDGIGTFGLGFKGSSLNFTTFLDYDNGKLADAKSQINFAFDLTAIENLKLQVGVSYPLPADIDGDHGNTAFEDEDENIISLDGTIDSRQNPITIGLRADYTVESSFGVRAMLGVALGGRTTYTSVDDSEDSFTLGVTLDPWVNVGVGNIGLSLSLQTKGASKIKGADQKDDHLDFEVTPYFSKSYGGGSFYAGFRLGFGNYFDDKDVDDESGKVYWAVPVGLSYSF
jgi:hypothetical protein